MSAWGVTPPVNRMTDEWTVINALIIRKDKKYNTTSDIQLLDWKVILVSRLNN